MPLSRAREPGLLDCLVPRPRGATVCQPPRTEETERSSRETKRTVVSPTAEPIAGHGLKRSDRVGRGRGRGRGFLIV